MSSTTVELSINDIWEDGLGENASIQIYNLNETINILDYNVQSSSFQRIEFTLKNNEIYKIKFKNTSNLYESTIDIRIKNVSISKIEFNNIDIIENDYILFLYVKTENQIFYYKRLKDVPNYNQIDFNIEPYNFDQNRYFYYNFGNKYFTIWVRAQQRNHRKCISIINLQ